MPTPHRQLVGMIMDRFRWWANPPETMRPTPALAGWTLDQWVEAAGILEHSREERFRLAYPSTMVLDLQGYELAPLALQAMQILGAQDEVERINDYEPFRWRARPKPRIPV